MDQIALFFDNILFRIFGSFDLLSLIDYVNKPFYVLFWVFLKNGGFILFGVVLLWCIKQYYMDAVIGKYFSKVRRICLSINIPKNNLQTPQSVESIFIQLLPTYSKPNFKEKFFDGKSVDTYSFEIVSLDGYIQFLIQLPSGARDFIEASIFAQYPDAEIIEVPDYTRNLPQSFPSEGWDMWGTELAPPEGTDFFPLKTYEDFIDKQAEEARFKDPLAGVLEIMSKLKMGENLCFQILVRARYYKVNNDWVSDARKKINEIIGIKKVETKKKGFFSNFSNFFPVIIIKDFFSMLIHSEISKDAEEKKEEKVDTTGWATKILPDQKTKIELIEKKIAKPIFECKVRLMYIGKKETFNKPKGISGSLGAIFQFNNLNGMQISPQADVTTNVAKFLFPVTKKIIKRQNLFLKGYYGRNMSVGGEKFVMNVEELATLFHFPPESVRTPMMTKVESKKVEPPMDLPTIE